MRPRQTQVLEFSSGEDPVECHSGRACTERWQRGGGGGTWTSLLAVKVNGKSQLHPEVLHLGLQRVRSGRRTERLHQLFCARGVGDVCGADMREGKSHV